MVPKLSSLSVCTPEAPPPHRRYDHDPYKVDYPLLNK